MDSDREAGTGVYIQSPYCYPSRRGDIARIHDIYPVNPTIDSGNVVSLQIPSCYPLQHGQPSRLSEMYAFSHIREGGNGLALHSPYGHLSQQFDTPGLSQMLSVGQTREPRNGIALQSLYQYTNEDKAPRAPAITEARETSNGVVFQSSSLAGNTRLDEVYTTENIKAENGVADKSPSSFSSQKGVTSRHNEMDANTENKKLGNGGSLQSPPLSSSEQGKASRLNERKPINAIMKGNQSLDERRMLRHQYRSLRGSITDDGEWKRTANFDKFETVFEQVQSLHHQVQRPREQIVDAEALLNITGTFLETVRSAKAAKGVTPVDFIKAITQQHGYIPDNVSANMIQPLTFWGDLGLEASGIFCDAAGMSTMVGPMENKSRKRKVNSRHQAKPSEQTRPVEICDSGGEENAETTRNMATMFNILKKHRRVGLETLVLNKLSFSQTVENIFALSFLVKDGRVEIQLDEDSGFFVVPKNAPKAKDMVDGESAYSQFILRFDYKDWKWLKDLPGSDQALMPHRTCWAPNTVSGSHSRKQNRVPQLPNAQDTSENTHFPEPPMDERTQRFEATMIQIKQK